MGDEGIIALPKVGLNCSWMSYGKLDKHSMFDLPKENSKDLECIDYTHIMIYKQPLLATDFVRGWIVKDS